MGLNPPDKWIYEDWDYENNCPRGEGKDRSTFTIELRDDWSVIIPEEARRKLNLKKGEQIKIVIERLEDIPLEDFPPSKFL